MTALTTATSIAATQPHSAASGPASLYKTAAWAALACVLVALTDIILTFFPLGAGAPGELSAAGWFELFHQNWFFGMRNLGLLPNILTMLLMLPLFLALYLSHREASRESAALALIVSLLGTAVYLANNAAFPMLALSTRYFAATTGAQRALLAAAGEAVLARGEDFTAGAFPGLILGEVAFLAISLVMLRGGIFPGPAGILGIVGGLLLGIFTIWSTFLPGDFAASMLIAMLGGLASIAWYVLTSRRLFQLARELPAQPLLAHS